MPLPPRRTALSVAAATAVHAAVAAPQASAAHTSPTHDGTWTYSSPASLGGSLGLKLGGFSDLFPVDSSGREFWTVTDRGPNADAAADTDKVFLKPDYTPRILKIRLKTSGIEVEQSIPLRVPAHYKDPVTGTQYLTGLPPAALTSERPVDTGGAALPGDPYGVDSEGLVRAADGSFWVSSEYGSTIWHVSSTGTVREALVPKGSSWSAPGVTVLPVLPAIEARQKNNRGLEGLAVSADGRTLYAAQQSPLANPTGKAGKSSRNLRIFRIDISKPHAPRVTGEFVNVRDADSATDGDWGTSAIVWLGPDRLLVEERDGARPTAHTLLYQVDLRKATNILGSAWDDPSGTPLEGLSTSALAAAKVVPGAKQLLFDAAAGKLANGKIEGIALLPAKRGTAELYLVGDNDFGVGSVSGGKVVPNNAPTQLDKYTLPSGTVSFG